MRILFYSSIFPRPSNPSLGIYCYHICRALNGIGHEVRVVSPRPWLDRPQRDNAPLPLARFDELRVEYPPYFYTPSLFRSAYHHFMWASSRRVVKQLLREFRPDAVLSYWAHPDGAVAVRIAQAAGVASGIIVGGSDVLILPNQSAARRRAIVRALNACDAALCVGRDLAEATKALGVAAEKVHVVPQGVDTNVFNPGSQADARRRLGVPEHGKLLTFVGNLLPVKGLDILLDALALLQRREVVCRLYLVGSGASRGALEAQVSKLGLTEAVTFVGAVAQSDLPDWYRAADLTVLSSRSEGIPNALRESLACGTPFVATNVGGVHEIADGNPHPLLTPGDPAALAEGIRQALAKEKSQVGNRSVTWEQSAEHLINVLRVSRASARCETPPIADPPSSAAATAAPAAAVKLVEGAC